METKQIECTRCGSSDFGIEEIEEDHGWIESVYCKNCLLEKGEWSFPKPSAFGKESA